MDCRVKPGNDIVFRFQTLLSAATAPRSRRVNFFRARYIIFVAPFGEGVGTPGA
jgi:hypothetical protein